MYGLGNEKMEKTVVELFAGVGGFRVGFNNIKKIDKTGKAIENGPFTFVWSDQYEPSTKVQHAFECYNTRFPEKNNSNEDISKVDKKNIPNHTVLCGGFPCQDYSVAHSLSSSKGIEGKKGVLWWEINEILKVKKPEFVVLENVDRLVKSPAKQRGRDFAIMLYCFNTAGYSVEWRIINAAEYGFPQRRKRIYIFAYRKNTNYYKKCSKIKVENLLFSDGLFSKQFLVKHQFIDLTQKIKEFNLNNYSDLVDVSNNFMGNFENAGLMRNGKIYSTKVEPIKIKQKPLKNIIEKGVIDEHYFLTPAEIDKYKYLRGSKKIKRVRPNGETYYYSEGNMSPFDSLDLPGRTMLTSEGTTNRSTHIIKDIKTGKLRILTPIECERLDMFPDNWTNTNMPEKRRYFMMGNALVCGVIRKIAEELSTIIDDEK